MSEYEHTEHLLNEIERLREANFELREGELRQRIKQLEAVVNDPHALWANWLRGDVKLPAGIGDVRQYQERIKRLEGELESTKLDRDSWSDQSDEFAKTAADLIIRIQRLEEAGDALKAAGYFGGFGDAVNKWIKVREDKL